MTRLILDISTIARWTGPPVGIVRVEFELAQHAMRRGHGVQLTFYDPVTASLRALEPAWQKLVLGLDGVIDTIGIDFVAPAHVGGICCRSAILPSCGWSGTG